MYTVADYGAMIADDVRMNAFIRALRQVVTPNSVVADIGTGTGIFALIACRFGARRVYAIEPADVIQVAREIAAANGYAGRIEFMQAVSTDITLPERADVIISDLGGVLPWFGRHIPAIVDARRRLLAEGGTLIPQRDVAWSAVVEAPELYAQHVGSWDSAACGFDMEPARRIVVNSWGQGRITRDQVLTDPQRWGTVDYRTVVDPDVQAEVSCLVTRDGTGHGMAAGFDRTVGDGITLSTAPDAPDTIRPRRIYGTAFFPWPSPVSLRAGDVVTFAVRASLVGSYYIWTWNTRIVDRKSDLAPKAEFSQSTFLGAPLSPTTLKKRSSAYVPVLTEDGRIARLVLDAMAEGISIGAIAERVFKQFPDRFDQPQDALSHVAELSRQYG